MKIKVRVRATGVTEEIEESAFDAALHERIEARTVGELGADEFMRGIGEAVGQAVSAGLEGAGVGRVDRSRVAVPPTRQSDRPIGDAAIAERVDALRPAWEARYAGLPEWERRLRSAEGDVLTWRYFRMMASGNVEGAERLLRAEDPVYSRASMGVGSAGIGGALVPTPLANFIMVKRDKFERIGPRAMRITSPATTFDLPAEATVGDVAGVLENAASTDTDSTFSLTQLVKQKAMRTTTSSRELLSDVSGAFDLSSILGNQAARRFAVYYDTQAAQTGEGTPPNHSLAIAQAALSTVTGSGGAITRAKVMALLLGLPSEWRDGPDVHFMGNANVTYFLSQLVDGTGRPIYGSQSDPARPIGDVGNVTMIVEGRPYIEIPMTADNLVVGVISEGFAVLDDGAIRVEMSTEAGEAFRRDQMVWKFVGRRDSAVIRTDCWRKTDAPVEAPA